MPLSLSTIKTTHISTSKSKGKSKKIITVNELTRPYNLYLPYLDQSLSKVPLSMTRSIDGAVVDSVSNNLSVMAVISALTSSLLSSLLKRK